MCGIIVIGVHAIVEAKRHASFLKKLILVFCLGINMPGTGSQSSRNAKTNMN